MIEVIDQTGNTVRLLKRPDRIVSVVPSQTELLADLGLEERIAGITKFCIHPDPLFRSKPRVGGTKSLNIQKISTIDPDLIIANKEENLKEEIESLKQFYPVYTSDISDLNGSLKMIKDIGELTDASEGANRIAEEIRFKFNQLEQAFKTEKELTCLYFIWQDPWMIAGKNTFINDLMNRCRLVNLAPEDRYPETDTDRIQSLNPDIILLSSEPYPFKEKHLSFFHELLPQTKTILADGEMFSWYGSRLLKAPEYLQTFRNSLI